jgi:universal stress protein E
MNNNLLVVLDNTEGDMAVVTRAVELARKLGASIELFSCVYDAYIAGERFFDSPDLDKAKATRLAAEKAKLEEAAKRVRDEGVEVSVDVLWDTPVFEGIVRKVMRSQPRMVLRNNQYHSAIGRAIFSNDDWSLIRSCPAPLLIVRPRAFKHEGVRIAAAVDPLHRNDKPAELDSSIIESAKMLTEVLEGDLQIVHTFDATAAIAASSGVIPTATILPGDEIREEVREQHETRLYELTDAHDIPRDHVHNIEGDSRIRLPEFAIDSEIDVMVVGAVSRNRIKRWLIGSTAEKILDKLPCDLLILKPKGFQTSVSADSPHEFHSQPAA